jgi:hypothetical protein
MPRTGVVGRRALVIAFSAAALCAQGGVEPLALDKPLLASYSFDEAFGVMCADAGGRGCDAAAEGRDALGVGRAEGVFGNALDLAGDHRLKVGAALAFGRMPALSLSAWTLPTALGDFREIFRKEDGDNRVLFSFQGGGTILSLGLNVGGYVECDAPVDPKVVMDGNWHHCAATFDGKSYRVYFDGKELGALERPGAIQAGGPAAACIGSSEGGECFQGFLDELRIYAAALAADEVAALYRNGKEALATQPKGNDAGELALPRRLLAHLTFNERRGAAAYDRSGAVPPHDARADSPIGRTAGVYGNALDLRGTHALGVDLGLEPGSLAALSFSVWARPT